MNVMKVEGKNPLTRYLCLLCRLAGFQCTVTASLIPLKCLWHARLETKKKVKDSKSTERGISSGIG